MGSNILLGFVISLFFLTQAHAHQLILQVMDNGDDTITIVGGFDTGASAVGALVRLEAVNGGDTLYEKRLPQESELRVSIPDEPYQIVLDGGPGHVSVKDGIPPAKGFAVKADKKKAVQPDAGGWRLPLVLSTGLAFCLLFLTLFISIHNTNKIRKAIANESGQ